MSESGNGSLSVIMVPPEFWGALQDVLQQAIAGCNDIAASVEAHQRLGLYSAGELLDQINGKARDVRKLLETIEVPF